MIGASVRAAGSLGRGSGRAVEGPPAATGQTRREGSIRDGPSAHRALDSRTRWSTADAPTVQDPPDGREGPVRQLRDLAERKTSVVPLHHEAAQPVQQFRAGPGGRGAPELRQRLELRARRVRHRAMIPPPPGMAVPPGVTLQPACALPQSNRWNAGSYSWSSAGLEG